MAGQKQLPELCDAMTQLFYNLDTIHSQLIESEKIETQENITKLEAAAKDALNAIGGEAVISLNQVPGEPKDYTRKQAVRRNAWGENGGYSLDVEFNIRNKAEIEFQVGINVPWDLYNPKGSIFPIDYNPENETLYLRDPEATKESLCDYMNNKVAVSFSHVNHNDRTTKITGSFSELPENIQAGIIEDLFDQPRPVEKEYVEETPVPKNAFAKFKAKLFGSGS